MSNLLMMMGTGSPKQSYWIATLGAATSGRGYGVVVDAASNVRVSGYVLQGNEYGSLATYNTNGVLNWQRKFGASAKSTRFRGVAVDSSSNVFAFAETTGTNEVLLTKHNTSGSLQWQRELPALDGTAVSNVTVDASGNPYIGALTGSGSVTLIKYNTSGTLQWQRRLVTTTGNVGGIYTDFSSNIYIAGKSNSNNFLFAKYDSSGAIQWQRTVAGTSAQSYAAAASASGDVYFIGTNDPFGTPTIYLFKYNSTGTLQWQRKLTSGVGRGVSTDSSNNVYIVGDDASSNLFVAKYNSSGTIQWQRSLSGSSAGTGTGISAISGSAVCVTGGTSTEILVAKLPNDGSLTGTYGGFTYTASSLTDAAGTLTSVTSTLTDAAGTLTDAAGTLTDAAGTLTSTTTTL